MTSITEITQNFDDFKYGLRVKKKTFGVNILRSLSQVREAAYTSSEKTCIETNGNITLRFNIVTSR